MMKIDSKALEFLDDLAREEKDPVVVLYERGFGD
jgi:hypothetical protein